MTWLARVSLAVTVPVLLFGMWANGDALPPLAKSVPDEVWHAVLFGGLTLLCVLALPRIGIGVLALALIAIGIGIEGMQSLLPTGRETHWNEAGINVAAVALTLPIARAALLALRKRASG
ncbi:MAG: hypothetical protein AAGB03_10420 [Pseudomonadota bacterium]